MGINSSRHVVACIPYYGYIHYIRRAVDGLLAQTHKDLTVIVVNDADTKTPPWPQLADIDDHRLIRFDLRQNKGSYFAYDVVLNATEAPFFLVQDCDDWSVPHRIEYSLAALESEKSDLAGSYEIQFKETIEGDAEILGVWNKNHANSTGRVKNHMEAFCTYIDESYKYRISHHALFRSSALQSIGGYYCGLRQHSDKLLTNLLLMTCRVSHVKEPLYWRLHWPEAITKHPDTGFGSVTSEAEMNLGQRLYSQAYDLYCKYLKGDLSATTFAAYVRNIFQANVAQEDKRLLGEETKRLRYVINSVR
jgi:glycosyltransferase involved in cell wall biosynthesis